MTQRLRLRLIYALHMLAPLSFVLWHSSRLEPDTLRGLLAMFR